MIRRNPDYKDKAVISFGEGFYYTGRVTSDSEPNAHRGTIAEAYVFGSREAAIFLEGMQKRGFWLNAEVVEL